ncbi:MAG: hypothetical protein ABIS86_11830 [Streptosporangiaceae bacterium]
MNDALAYTLIASSLAVAAWLLVLARLDRPPQVVHLIVLAVLEAGLIAQVVLAVVRLAGGHEPPEQATFLGYLAGSLVILPIGAFVGVGERSKWGSVAVGLACVTVPVVILRMQQLWTGNA